MEARFTLTTTSKDSICAGQKGFPGGFSPKQIELAVDTALKNGETIRKKIKKIVELAKKK